MRKTIQVKVWIEVCPFTKEVECRTQYHKDLFDQVIKVIRDKVKIDNEDITDEQWYLNDG